MRDNKCFLIPSAKPSIAGYRPSCPSDGLKLKPSPTSAFACNKELNEGSLVTGKPMCAHASESNDDVALSRNVTARNREMDWLGFAIMAL
jgi:hypothetical protein